MIKCFPNWLMRRARWLGMALATAVLSIAAMQPAQAQISQTPLLTQSGSVEPNLVLMFDDSGSMIAQFLYQYGGAANGYGRTGPGVGLAARSNCIVTSPASEGVNCSTAATTPSITSAGTYNAPPSTWYFEMSPDVNGVYYNPKVLYTPRVDATGTFSTPGTTSSTAFNVYFYKNGSNVNVTWPGTTPTAAFPDPMLVTSYFSATTTYVPGTALLAIGATPLLSYPVSVATSTGPFPKFLNRTDCNGGSAGGSCSLAEERQNYANWKKYHSNRADLAKTGLGFAFQNLTSAIRVGWSTIKRLNGSSGTLDSGVGLYTQTQKNAFYSWLYGLTIGGGTPNRAVLANAGIYYSRSDNLGPWASTPDVSSTGIVTLATTTTDTLAIRAAQYSCRRSYSMLVTDGYYDNTDSPAIGIGNIDGTSITTITGTTAAGSPTTYSYNGTLKPYADSQSNTMADVAMKYWITDLRPDLPNNVKTIAATVVGGVTTTYGNESFWQNMSFYAVGLGVNGSLTQTITTRDQLTSGAIAWPTVPAAGGDETTIDDMWHATINARGRILSAANASALSDAVGGMLSEINKQASSQSGVAASSATLKTGTKKYTPKYTTGSWIGDVVATNLDASSGADLLVSWQVTGTDPSTTIAYNGIPASGSRNIYAWNSVAYGAFDSSNIYANANVVGSNANLINYLRGDQSNEGINGTAQYRVREKLLGDIVNSSPVFIKGDLDLSYDLLPAGTFGQSTYRAFVTTKAARTEGVLFAGANDGMLHGFRDSSGAEIFAFVPQAVMPNLHLLASKTYSHRYYVDGPLVEADACLSGGSACTTWSNLLLGSLGAGGKSVYAIDVTTPTAMSAASVKWEISNATTGYANMGNILSDVQTGLTASGQWVAVFGNGPYGADGVARLYVADLNTGTLIKEISTTVGGTATASLNGLGGVRLVLDANQRIQGAYAGDLQGNVWKFDLSNSLVTNWALGLSGSPLYKGTSTKSITAPPNVVTNPTGGRVVTFGTGKLFDATDVSTSATQTLYGIQDTVAFGSSTTPVGVTQTGTASLVVQTISSAITGTVVLTNASGVTSTSTISYYAVSSNPQTTTSHGWYINLPNTGQRVVNPILSLVGSFVLFDTGSPSNVSLDPCLQTGTGLAWNYVIDAVTGAGPTSAIFDTNGDGVITSADLIVSGYANTADGRTRVIVNDSKTTSTSTYFTPLSTQQQPGFSITCAMAGTCATPSVTNVIKRSWRQLFLR